MKREDAKLMFPGVIHVLGVLSPFGFFKAELEVPGFEILADAGNMGLLTTKSLSLRVAVQDEWLGSDHFIISSSNYELQ